MDEAKSGRQCSRCRAELERHVGDLGDGADVRLVVAGEDLDDGRLAGAVLADEGMDLAGGDLEVDVVERPLSGERLAQPVDAQGGIRGAMSVVVELMRKPPSPSPRPSPSYSS